MEVILCLVVGLTRSQALLQDVGGGGGRGRRKSRHLPHYSYCGHSAPFYRETQGVWSTERLGVCMLELGLDPKISPSCGISFSALDGKLVSNCRVNPAAHAPLWNISPSPWAGAGGLKKPRVARLTSQPHSPHRRATGKAVGYHPWLRGGGLRAFQGGQCVLERRNARNREEFHETVMA